MNEHPRRASGSGDETDSALGDEGDRGGNLDEEGGR